LLSSSKVYFVQVYAINSAGKGSPQQSTPLYVKPTKQLPGSPHMLVAQTGTMKGTISIIWQRPRVPHHRIPCSGSYKAPLECPSPYGGGNGPISDGGDYISEYEVEYNERSDFSGVDGGRRVLTAFSCTLTNLTEGRRYFVRVLARNAIGSGRFCERSGLNFCDEDIVSAIAKAA
jgi:hypothetical protein